MSQKPSSVIRLMSTTVLTSNIYLTKRLASNSGKTLKKWTDRSKYLANGKKKA